MDLDRLEAVLRPRTSFEAIDLGLAMSRRWAGPIYRAWLVGAAPIYALVWALLLDHPVVALAVVWWLKPLWDQAPLYVVSRALFGDVHGVRKVARVLPRLYSKQLFWGLLYYRLDWARSFFLPVLQLEQEGFAARRRRRAALLRSMESTTAWLTFVFLCLELVVALGLVALVAAFLPDAPELAPTVLAEAWWEGLAPLWVKLLVPVIAFASLTIIEPLYVTAGFSLYINRRTVLEGWDVELVFRRLSDRLGRDSSAGRLGAAAAVLLALTLSAGGLAHAEEALRSEPLAPAAVVAGGVSEAAQPLSPASAGEPSPEDAVRRVLSRREFDTQERRTVWRLRREWRSDDGLDDPEGPEWLQAVARLVATIIEPLLWAFFGIALIVGIVFVISRVRFGRGEEEPSRPTIPAARVGLSLPPAGALPPDVAAAAWSLWEQGFRSQALGLLYRGALVRLVEKEALPIEDGATEGECLGVVRARAAEATATFFAELTSAWQRSAYAHRDPPEAEAERLCRLWPTYFEVGP